MVRYEINGKQYSYSTNNRAQTAEAKKRIAAAKAAEAAKAKADAEKAKDPLATVFGSAAQKEAKEAEAQLQQLMAGPAEYMAISQPTRDRAGSPGKRIQDKQARQGPVAESPQQPPAALRETAAPAAVSASTASLLIAERVDPTHQTRVKSVSFDIETGIKTTIMTGGSIEEEPFDSSVLSFLTREPEKMNSLAAFVNRLRKAAPEETTSSIRTSVVEPEDGSLIRHR